MLFHLPGKRLMLCQIHLLPLNGLMISKRELIKCKRLLVKPTLEEVVSGMVVFLRQKLILLHLNNQLLNSISSLLKSLSSNLNSTQAMPKKTKHAQTNLALSSTVYQSNQLNTTPSTRELSFLTSFNQLFQPSTCNGSIEKLPLRAKMLIKSSLSFQFTWTDLESSCWHLLRCQLMGSKHSFGIREVSPSLPSEISQYGLRKVEKQKKKNL